MPEFVRHSGFNDLPEILRLRVQMRELSRRTAAELSVVQAPRVAIHGPSAIGLLAGSFNPLTQAHVSLAREAIRAAALSALFFCYSTHTIGKEAKEGAIPEERVIVLQRYAAHSPSMGVLITNAGLYADQALAARHAFGPEARLFTVVGFDKLRQILDPSYYEHSDRALWGLFAVTTLLVAARDGADRSAFDDLISRPENAPFAHAITFLPFAEQLQALSSSKVRRQLAHGDMPADSLPEETIGFVRATGAYLPALRLSSGERIDRYDLRLRLIDLIESHPRLIQEFNDLSPILATLVSNSANGRELRRALAQDAEDAAARLCAFVGFDC